MAQIKGSPSWSDLPLELLGLVFLRLPTRADRASFPAVCRTWCSSVQQCRLPPPSPVPWLLLPDGSTTSFPHRETFQLPDGMRYLNSSGEWLLLSRNDGSCFLMNHFTKATMPLPSLSSRTYYQEPNEGIEDDEDYMAPEIWGTWLDNKDNNEISVISLVVCSTRLITAIIAIGSFSTVALCRPGSAAWSVILHEVRKSFSDMVFLQGKIYTLNLTAGRQDLIAIDIVDEYDSEPRVSRIDRLIKGISFEPEEFFRMHYLLEFHGTLLMVCRKLSYKIERGDLCYNYVAGSSEFAVYETNLEQRSWSAVRTLGNDQALFLGQGCSKAVRVSPYDLSRDCIFFLNDFTGYWKKATACQLYDIKEEKIYSPLPMVSWKSGKVPAIWLFSQGATDEAANSR